MINWSFVFIFLAVSFTSISSLELTEKTDYATCSCDLIPGLCEINCCCDADCPVLFQKVTKIENCLSNATNAIPNSCILKYIQSSSDGFKQTTNDNPDWGCLYSISDTSAFYYDVPKLLTSLTSLNDAITSLKNDGSSSSTSTTISTNAFYKKSELMYVLYSNAGDTTVSYFNLPGASQFSSGCNDVSYIKFLEDRSSTCERSFSGQNPTLLSMFKASTFYYIALYNSPSGANARSNTVTTKCSDVECTSILEPSEDLTSYKDLVNSVSFLITYSATSGLITNTTLTITVQPTILKTQTSLTQTFSVKFQSDVVYEGTMYQRSGNPGYLVGKPVIGGDSVTIVTNPTTGTTADIIRVKRDSNQWFTVVAGGKCDELTGKRRPVLFGVNTYSSCYLELRSSDTFNCDLKSFEIIQILKGTSQPSYLAIWGNSDPDKIGEWVPLIVSEKTISISTAKGSKDEACSEVVTGANIDIIYANVGLDNNPQSKILGARMSFVLGSIQYKCSGLECVENKVQRIPISTSVRFIDGSDQLELFEKAKPVFLARLPYDFYYPFLLDSGSFCSPNFITLIFSSFIVAFLLLLQ